MHALADSLAKVEQDLLRGAEPKRMGALAEDELIDLHKRIRRARNKYAGIYRRQGSSKVSKKGGRGLAMEKNARNAGRSEVFRGRPGPSQRPARRGCFRGRRAAQGREARGSQPGRHLARCPRAAQADGDEQAAAQVSDRTPKGQGREKRNASSQAKGARRQAKRDNR